MFLHTERLNLLSEFQDIKKAKFSVIGVPFDSTETNIPGQRLAPNSIRSKFLALEADGIDQIVYDSGNLIVVHGNAKATIERFEQTIEDMLIYNENIIPITLGGEHTITLGAVKALKKTYENLQIISLDAHYDMKNDYQGEKLSHSSVMKRICELGVKTCVLGVRTGSDEEIKNAKNIIITDIEDLDKDAPIYLSIDMDVLDPSIAPGVSDPEPSGWTFEKLVQILDKLKLYNVVGIDIVEANPLLEEHITSTIASRILFRLLKN
ncbi:MAG: agmatinase [DPANN group archaeon]|nr:agmatinase [DPANN group archaeon]